MWIQRASSRSGSVVPGKMAEDAARQVRQDLLIGERGIGAGLRPP
jgi:hypothetical protein